MAIAIAEAAAAGADLREPSTQDTVVTRWYAWSRTAKDVGIQTGAVLRAAARDGRITAERARAESAALHQRCGRTAGNGSLMRTAPVALAYLDDEQAMVAAARAISELTHYDPDAGDACVLWCAAIAHAVRTGQLDVRIGCQRDLAVKHPKSTAAQQRTSLALRERLLKPPPSPPGARHPARVGSPPRRRHQQPSPRCAQPRPPAGAALPAGGDPARGAGAAGVVPGAPACTAASRSPSCTTFSR